MLSPFDLVKDYLTFKAYFPWFCSAIILWGGVLFLKRIFSPSLSSTWKGSLISFLIILVILSCVYFAFFRPKDSAAKHVGQLITQIDKAIDKYDQTINDYKGLKSQWEGELKKTEAELKSLSEQQTLTQEQKAKIVTLLAQTEVKITDIQTQKQATEKNLHELKGQLQIKEQSLNEQEKTKKTIEQEIAQEPVFNDREKLKFKLRQKNEEICTLIGEISEFKIQIGKAESKRQMYEDMLSRSFELKERLQRNFTQLSVSEQNLFSAIESAQERRAQIQQNINQIEQKISEIDIERVIYRDLKKKYQMMHANLTTHEKNSELSAGNVAKWGFKAFDKVTDLIPAKYGIKTLGKTINVTQKFAQGMTKTTLVLHEGHRLFHIINDSVNETKESPRMITKEALDSYTSDIDRDLAKLDADKKDYERKIEEYKFKTEGSFLDKKIHEESTERDKLMVQRGEGRRTIIDEYGKIINELNTKISELHFIDSIYTKKGFKNDELAVLEKEREKIIEELNSEYPNYASLQQRIAKIRQPRIPDLVMIPNK